jgi:NO-binding membrane sensor protein with MHYT domain
MSEWRKLTEGKEKVGAMVVASISLGGCGIWGMHFTGMGALKILNLNGTEIVMSFDGGMTLFSMVLPVAGVYLGLYIASRDPFFLELEHTKRQQMIVVSTMLGMDTQCAHTHE